VSRATSGALALALAAALILLPGGPLSGNRRAAAADCAWQPHSKRVVKHVRRHGRPHRLVRVKRWWSCDPLPATPAPGMPATPLPTPSPAPGPEPEPPPRRVSVRAEDDEPEEFSFGLSRPYVVSGEVTVELNNQGQDPHSLDLRPVGGEGAPLLVGEAGPGESRAGRFDLAPGRYRLWCSLPQHDEWGMNAELEVRAG
jgi:hypothetical protein